MKTSRLRARSGYDAPLIDHRDCRPRDHSKQVTDEYVVMRCVNAPDDPRRYARCVGQNTNGDRCYAAAARNDSRCMHHGGVWS